ncbi:MAG: S8 family serine peptidase [Bacteroidia bacterium]
MKKIFTFCTLLLASFAGIGQAPTKFDFYLAQKQNDVAQHRLDANKVIEVLVKGNIGGIKQLVKKYGGTFKYSYGNIAAIRIPLSALSAFYLSNSVIRMEGAPPHIKPCNDTMRIHAHIVDCQMGVAPLTQSYKGKGVIVGMIDTGIDFVHMDFRDSLNNSRILSIWDMNKDSDNLTPMPYGYGREYDQYSLDTALWDNIPSVIASMDSSSALDAHGSHVSGVATANGRANGLSIGAAPEAGIMMVAFNFTNQTNNEMTDAVSFLYNKAEVLGEPCVINASLGDYDGSHDGYDLQALMIDSMITAEPGRVFVAAAGNGSSIPYHLGYTATPGDTSFTWFAYYAQTAIDYYGGNIYYDLWTDTTNFRNLQYAFGADRIKPFSPIATTSFHSIPSTLGTTVTDTVKNKSGNIIGIVQSYAQFTGRTYELQVSIHPDSTQAGKISNDSSYYWRLITTATNGGCRIDCWYPDPTPIVDSGLPGATIYPEIKNYKMPDTISTLCSSFQCSPNVITVGDFYNRRCWIDYDTNYRCLFSSNVTEGELTPYSGVGPTRDGRIKPDVSSPGDICMSVLPTPLRAENIFYAPINIDSGAYHVYDGGTSTASPGTAGAAALYLELHPNATNIEVKNALTFCADQDIYTGSTPNNSYGYGKTDAFKALTACAALGIPSIQVPSTILSAYPNPMKDQVVIEYDFSAVKDYCYASIAIYDVMGKQLQNIELKTPQGTVSVRSDGMASGTYFYSLLVDNKRLHTEKLMVTK